MPILRPIFYAVTALDAAVSRIADLAFRARPDGTAVLYATTRYDGALTAYTLGNPGGSTALTRIDSAAHSRPGGVGGVAEFAFLDTVSGPALLTGGGVSGALGLRGIAAAGDFGDWRQLGRAPSLSGDLLDMTVVTAATGASYVYGGIAGGPGVGRVTITAAGALGPVTRLGDSATTYAERVTALTSLSVAGTTYLASASSIDPGVTLYAVSAAGGLSARASLGAEQGLWIAAPTALETASVAGRTYLILASAGSDSLTVIEVGIGGALAPRAHLLDDLSTRFAGVSALAVTQHHGLTYVIAGGADDGITVFLLMPGGQLVAEATLADSRATGLQNISALAAISRGDGIDIVVGSATEGGLTRLRFDTGPAGDQLTAGATGNITGATLTGGAGRDLIRGGAGADSLLGVAGDDILTDGAGSDRLAGGAGADLFVLAYDRTPDTISDFSPGVDRVNLSAWPMLRSTAQLTFTTLPNGIRITYGDEVLILLSADGRPIIPGQLPLDDLIGGANLPVVAIPGFPGPLQPDPDLPPRLSDDPPPRDPPRDPVDPLPEPLDPPGGTVRPPDGPADDGHDLRGTPGADRLMGGAQADAIWGRGSADRLFGMGGNDKVKGEAGADTISGGTGNDRVTGGAGDDRADGGAGNDRLAGGGGADLLWGQAGRDVLRGQGGTDRLIGGADDDALQGGGGNDKAEGGAGRDRIAGQAGNDTLWGQDGADMISGGGGHDALAGGTGNDRLAGNGGNDALRGQDGADRLAGGGGADRLSGEAGADRLAGNAGRDRLTGGAGDDVLTGGGAGDTFVFAPSQGAAGRGGNRDHVTDWGRGDTLALDRDLWDGRLSAAQLVARFADILRGDLVFDFGHGNRLTLDDVGSLGGIAGRLDLG